MCWERKGPEKKLCLLGQDLRPAGKRAHVLEIDPVCAMGHKQEAELSKTEVVSKFKAGSCISGHVAWQTKREYCFCNVQWGLAWIFKTQCFKHSTAWGSCGYYHSNTATPDSVGATVLFPGSCFVCLLCLWAWGTLELSLLLSACRLTNWKILICRHRWENRCEEKTIFFSRKIVDIVDLRHSLSLT